MSKLFIEPGQPMKYHMPLLVNGVDVEKHIRDLRVQENQPQERGPVQEK
jgi:hypothetical protein